MTASFVDQLTAAVARNQSLLCIGLDPEVGKLPVDFLPGSPAPERIKAFCLNLIEQTHDLVCCYKPNIAFFEQYGPEGLAALREVVAACHAAGAPVLLDAKRGDIGNTAKAYAQAVFESLDVDAVTASPYLGQDSIAPFLDYAGKAVFVLCFTSNPSAASIQRHGIPPLFEKIAIQAQTWGSAAQIGFVVGATQPEALADVRALAPDSWILAPGVGAQGGDLAAALKAGLDARGSGLIVPVSRAVLYAADPRAAANELRAQINQARQALADAALPDRKTLLIRGLFEAGCVKFGKFTLASGKTSPIYVDLRRVISFPDLFQRVSAAYTVIVRELAFDRIAPVPYAAMPAATAVALTLGRPMIYPRKEVKAHGTGQSIEGAYEPGQVAVAIEDVVTSGGSLLGSIEMMRNGGLKVNDVVVLVDREQGGGAALAAANCRLHAVLTISQILETLRDEGCITEAIFDEVRLYLAG